VTERGFEDRPANAGLPEVVDDDYPERERYPEPEEPSLPSDDGYQGAGSVGTTVEEQLTGESLDRRLAQEQPEPFEDPLRPRGIDEPRDDLAALTDPERAVPDELVAPDLGAGEDTEKDEVAQEAVGSRDPSPEAAAVRVRYEEG
jgi:hypothetical protein